MVCGASTALHCVSDHAASMIRAMTMLSAACNMERRRRHAKRWSAYSNAPLQQAASGASSNDCSE